MSSSSYDVVVIGAGTGGYPAAIRAAQLGLKVACIDKWINKQGKPALGGTCLNVGCIPSKALLETSHKFADIRDHSKAHGISTTGLKVDIPKTIDRKDAVVSELTAGIAQLFSSHKIDWLQGTATISQLNGGNKSIEFVSHDGEKQSVSTRNIIIASGSISSQLPFAPYDHQLICDSESALNWSSCPKKLGVIGAGAIGLEMSSVWARYGAEVTVLDALESLLPAAESIIAKTAEKEFTKQGLSFKLGAMIEKITPSKNKVNIEYTHRGVAQKETFDKVIVAVGRKPVTDQLLADGQQLSINNAGFVEVDDYCQTAVAGVYAVGDVVRGPMLAHKGAEEGVMVAELIAGHHAQVNYDAIPMVIYTHPEIAWVGLTSDAAKEKGHDIKTGKFPFAACGRAKAAMETTGLITVVSDTETDRVLGVHMFGAGASEMVAQAVIAIEMEATTEDLQRMVFAHPTLSEVLHEACLDVDGHAIHMVSRQKRK